ncbi:MAG: sulfatase-like hydrolase/transferase [Ruminococcus sp.]|nr:sulfatase-like hydrolase/transferase [Ruminococcus sp.]
MKILNKKSTKLLDVFNDMNKHEQNIFAAVFLLTAIILYLPLLITNDKDNIHIFIIFTMLLCMLICCKASGILSKLTDYEQNIAKIAVFISAPFCIAYAVSPAQIPGYYFFNLFIIFIPYIILFFIFRDSRICISAVSIVCSILYIINKTLIIVRGVGLNIFDFLALKTALSVSSNYSFEIKQDFYNSVLCAAFIITASFFFPLKPKKIIKASLKKFLIYFSLGSLLISLAATFYNVAFNDSVYNWNNQDLIYKRGVCYNLVMGLKEQMLSAPDGYSKETAYDIIGRYEADTEGKSPNIIVVMNESFADLRNISSVVPSEEYMPFFKSINQNVTKGSAVVSCFGGRTCNSEFEFLTGMTMTFLPQNSYPYLQYINGDMNTLIRDMDSEIYQKIYIHPYIASNYKRSTIYPFLGFDSFYDGLSFSTQDSYNEKYTSREAFLEYEGVEMIRGFIGDGVTYDKAIELFENKGDDKKIIEFIVTMQNHSPYNYDKDDFVSDVTVTEHTPDINQYLSLIKISDSELERLINYFSNSEEDVVIVFFGDHMPLLDFSDNYADLMLNFEQKSQEMLNMYSTPFLIWTNFDTDTEYIDYVSLNYLSVLMKEKAGMSLTDFDKLRKELYQKYPVFSTNIIIDNEENYYYDYRMIDDDLINQYEYMQYFYLFDN